MISFNPGPDTSLYFNGVNRERSFTSFWLGTDMGFRTYGRFNQNQITRNMNGMPKEVFQLFTNLFEDGDMQDPGTGVWDSNGGTTLSKIMDGGRQVLFATATGDIRISQQLDPDFLKNNIGKRIVMIYEVETSEQFDVSFPVDVRMRTFGPVRSPTEPLPESSYQRYTMFSASFVIHPDTNVNNTRLSIMCGSATTSLKVANMIAFIDEGGFDGTKFEMKSLLDGAGNVSRGAAPSNSEIFASFSDLEEKEITVSLNNVGRHFSEILRPGPFRERLIGKVSFIQQGFVERSSFVELGHSPSTTSRVVFIGKAVGYDLSRSRFTIRLREL